MGQLQVRAFGNYWMTWGGAYQIAVSDNREAEAISTDVSANAEFRVIFHPQDDYDYESAIEPKFGRFIFQYTGDSRDLADSEGTISGRDFTSGDDYSRTYSGGDVLSQVCNYIGCDPPYYIPHIEGETVWEKCIVNCLENGEIRASLEQGQAWEDMLPVGVAYKDGIFYDTPLDLDNPYTDSEPEDDGGNGDADWSRTANVLRDLPDNFFTESGMVTVYTPTSAQLMALSDYLWSDNGLDLDQFKKIVNDPFDILMGLNYLPFKVTVAGTKGVNVGNILSVDTNLTMNYPTKENYSFSFGSVSLKEEMNAFCDYSPHSKLSIHLPFIGTQALDIDLIRRGKYNPYTFELVYKYNIVTGCVMAYLISSDGVVVYSWAGNVATPIPMASNDYTNTINGLMGLATSAVSGAVTGGMLGGVPGAVGGALVGAATGGANTMSSLKPTVSTTGGIGSCAATLSPTLDAYFILEQPQMELDNKYKKYNGLPRNRSMKISNINAYGYNEVDGIKLEVNRATQSEKEEIERILRSGYIYGTPASGKTAAHVNPRPTLPEQNATQIALYQTTSSNMRIDKKCTHLHTYSNITMKEGTSITNPVITLCASDQNVCIANYAYIPKFHRYYYIEDVVNIGGHRFDEANQRDLYLWEIHLKCDVLMSHKSDIIDQTVIFKRSQAHYNLYLNDDRIQIDNRPHIYTRPFPNHLTNECTYVLLIAGHSVS